jgi:hypothetical protein
MRMRRKLSLLAVVFATAITNAAIQPLTVSGHGVTVQLVWERDFALEDHSDSDLRNQFDTLKEMGGVLAIEQKERLAAVFAELQRRGISSEDDKERLLTICLRKPFIPDTTIYKDPAGQVAQMSKQAAQYVSDAAAGKRVDVPVIDADSGVVIGFFAIDAAQSSFPAQPGDTLPIKRSFRGSKFDLTNSKRIYAIRIDATPPSTTGAKITTQDDGLQPIVEQGHLTTNKDFRWTVQIGDGFDGGKFSLSATLLRFENSTDLDLCRAGNCSRALSDGIVIPGDTITLTRKRPFIDWAKAVGTGLKSLFGWIGIIPSAILAWLKLRDHDRALHQGLSLARLRVPRPK